MRILGRAGRTAFGLATLATVATASLTGCAGGGQPQAGGTAGTIDLSNGLQIVTTTTQVTDFTKRVASNLGKKTEVTALLKPGQSAHSFEPSAADLQALAGADVVVQSGMGLEPWLADALKSSGFKGRVIDASQGFSEETIHAASGEHAASSAAPGATHDHAHDHADEHAGHDHAAETPAASSAASSSATPAASEAGHEGHHHDGPNPHLWVAPAGAKLMVNNIAEGLASADGDDAATIRKNASDYNVKVDALTKWVTANVNTVPEAERTIVTNHDALEYFTDQFGITQVGSIIPSWDDAAEPSAADIDALIKKMKEQQVKAIFSETQLSPKTAETIASQTGAKVYSGDSALYTDALGDAGSDGDTYLKAQVHNVKTIMEAWGHPATPAPADVTA